MELFNRGYLRDCEKYADLTTLCAKQGYVSLGTSSLGPSSLLIATVIFLLGTIFVRLSLAWAWNWCTKLAHTNTIDKKRVIFAVFSQYPNLTDRKLGLIFSTHILLLCFSIISSSLPLPFSLCLSLLYLCVCHLRLSN